MMAAPLRTHSTSARRTVRVRQPQRESDRQTMQIVEGVQIVASWYQPTDRSSRREYKFGIVHDSRKYSLEHVIGQPRLTYKPETDTHVLEEADRQIAALDEALRATMPERAGSSRTVGEARQARERQQEREQPDWSVPRAAQLQTLAAARAEGAAQTSRSRAARAAARPLVREQQLNTRGRT